MTTDFNNFMNSFFNDKFYAKNSDYYLSENEEAYVVSVDIPGIPPENVDITLDGTKLTVVGKGPTEGENGARKRSFKRVWSLPREIDSESINADIRYGVLNLILPKTAKASVKSIPINTS